MKALRQYEHTSKEQMQAATGSVNIDAKLDATQNTDIPDVKPTIDTNPSSSSTPGLSGNFHNCTISITMK